MKTVKTFVGVMFAIVASSTVFAVTTSELKTMTPEQKAANKAKTEKFIREKVGGFVKKPNSASGVVAFVNAQKRIPADKLVKPLAQINKRLRILTSLKQGDVAGLPTSKDVLASGGNLAVFIVDSEVVESALLVAPESRWAVVNVRALSGADVKQPIVEHRLQMEMLRAFAYLCGASNSAAKDSLMGPVKGNVDLDVFTEAYNIPVDLYQRMYDYLQGFGVTPFVVATYAQACQQGWAPSPTNEFQKAIWDKVRSIPTKPIKIEYDAKKAK